MKKYLFVLALLMLCSYNSFAQKKSRATSDKNMGIGVRLGDPTGVTFKKYLGSSAALEFVAGIPTDVFYGGYDYAYDYNHRYNGNGYYYDGLQRGFRYALQAHYTRLFDIKPVDGLQWYAGGGLQLRQYAYRYYYYDVYGKHEQRAVATQFGLDVIGGAEYTFEDVPFSVFADVNVFINVVNYPNVYVQPGVGGRFNF